MRHYLSGDLLAKMDRATMWSSLEARSPIMDHRVVDLAWRLAPSLKADGPRLKEVLRLSLERYLPRSLFDRPKRGFSAPLEYWLRRELREPAQDLLNSLMRHVEGRWNTGLVERTWNEQQAGTAHHADRLWSLITLELWRRHWNLDLP
jgi:asparagine synthase (glutamine-hydrolysing)